MVETDGRREDVTPAPIDLEAFEYFWTDHTLCRWEGRRFSTFKTYNARGQGGRNWPSEHDFDHMRKLSTEAEVRGANNRIA